MPFFRRADYRSEATQLIDQLKVAQPQLEAQQRAGRALLWDQNLDRAEQQAFKSAKVPQGAYVYQTLSDH